MDLEKAITTQEELDEIISEKLKQREEKIAQKYVDYEDLKTKSIDFDKEIKGLKKQLDETLKNSSNDKKTITELAEKVKSYQHKALKVKVAYECGIPLEIADRLTGDDENAIRTDAQNIRKLLSSKQPVAPLKSNENAQNSKETAYKTLVSNITAKGE